MKSTAADQDRAAQERLRRELLQRSDLVLPLPDFVVRLLTLLNRPETEPSDIESYLQNDQVLVARLLAMVNSPFYGMSRTIRTIKEAVVVLGFRGVRSLVLAISTARFLQRDFSCYGHDARGLWSHAASVAAGSRHLARLVRLESEACEQLFVAGLLHDIGKLVLAPYLTDALRGRHPTSTSSTVEFERELLGIDHTEAGALVAAKWNLSSEVQEVLKAHHDGATDGAEGSDGAAGPPTSACVRVADAVAHERGYGYAPGRAPAVPVLHADLELLGLTAPAQWDAVRNELVAAMEIALVGLAALSV